MKQIILFLSFYTALSISISAWSTEQIDDVFYVADKEYKIDELPLNQLVRSKNLSKFFQHQASCTASWRGYQARWRLNKDYLWLESIRKNPCSNEREYIDAKVLFKNQEYAIKAEWFTGTISLPVGEVDQKYDDSGENYLGYDLDVFVFNFKKGKLVSKGMEKVEFRRHPKKS